MLYPHSKEKELSKELFKNPGSEYRGTPFWAWNCKLEKNELLRQLDVFKQMGFGGAHMHVRTGLETVYLSDEHMELIKTCIEKSRQEKMLAWLYDEDRWPSGAAGGYVTKDEAFRQRHLLITKVPYKVSPEKGQNHNSTAEATRSENGKLLACFDVQLDKQGYLEAYRQIEQGRLLKGSNCMYMWKQIKQILGSITKRM